MDVILSRQLLQNLLPALVKTRPWSMVSAVRRVTGGHGQDDFRLQDCIDFAFAALIAVSADASAAGRAKRGGSEGGVQSAQKQKGAKEREDAYQNALKSIANGKANPDPWAGAR